MHLIPVFIKIISIVSIKKVKENWKGKTEHIFICVCLYFYFVRYVHTHHERRTGLLMAINALVSKGKT